MPYLIVIGVAALILGVAAGWYLRKKERWCPLCGGSLVCPGCDPAGVRRTARHAARHAA